jgi:hypothetical protein
LSHEHWEGHLSTTAATTYISEQPKDKAALLKKLHVLVMKGMPDAEVATKWGVPVYVIDGKNVCAIAGFKEHVSINFFVPAKVLPDPKKRLEGGKTNRALKIRTAAEIDEPTILRWVRAAAAAR